MAYVKTVWVDNSEPKINANRLNNIENGVETNDIAITRLIGKILWTNPTPTDDFDAQTITLSSNDYDVLEIFFANTTGVTRTNSIKILKGTGASLERFFDLNVGASQTTTFAQRLVNYITDTSYGITDCARRTGIGPSVPDLANNMIIPLYVIGYKIGLFEEE